MAIAVDSDETFAELLRRLLEEHGGRQAFVFGPDGAPFWSAFTPNQKDLSKLDAGLRFIEELEQKYAKPFQQFDVAANLLVAALDDSAGLYFIVVAETPPTAIEARLAIWRHTLLQHSGWLSREIAARIA